MAEHLVLRRFAGFTPYNAIDRIADRHNAKSTFHGYPRFCWYYGPMTWEILFRAMSGRRGRPYRAGDAGRRRRW